MRPCPEASALAMHWFECKQNAVAAEVSDLFGKYRLSEALMAVYKLFWDEFSSWYLELIKPAYGQPVCREVYDRTIGFFDSLLHLLHPFMPFITEELWATLVPAPGRREPYGKPDGRARRGRRGAVATVRDGKGGGEQRPRHTPFRRTLPRRKCSNCR